MPDNVHSSRGRPSVYKFDRGGTPAESGPYVGRVKNNIDPTRSGRLQVYIEQFAGLDEDDPSLWRTVSYIPPFYGATPHTGTNQGAGTFTGNQQSYGMWFTPPDLGVSVICFFVAGDPNQGYYTGCIPDIGISHMIPAIGASTEYSLQNGPQDSYFAGATQLPVTEINTENLQITEDPRFFDEPKPVHSYVAGIMMQQGIIRDTTRGPINSNSQRETPSAAFGIVTPGRAIYQGGINEREIQQQLDQGSLRPQDVTVIARRGGHSLVMDDGDLEGTDNLVRIRTAKGHQITMSDDGDCFYIIHANGQTWLEFGREGTVDLFSTNSVNVRTQGTINLHADKDINMFAGGDFNLKAKNIKMEGLVNMELTGTAKFTAYSKNSLGLKSDGSVNIKSSSGAWDGGGSLNFVGGCINLNSGGSATVDTPTELKDRSLADTKYVPSIGWTVEYGKLKTIVTRAPTHEPYPYHNQGVGSQSSVIAESAQPLNPQSAVALESLQNVLVNDGIEISDVANQTVAEIPVGSLETPQVTAMLAQTAKQTDQAADEVSEEKGIGQFGLSADQLEAAGYLKPGTVSTYLQDPNNLQSVLNSPSVWTGKGDIVTLESLLVDPKLQSVTQNEIMVASLDGLKKSGIVTGNESPEQLSPFVQVASKFGVDTTVDWVKGQAPVELVNDINSTAKTAQYAVNLLDKTDTALVSSIFPASTYVGTLDRQELDQAVTDILGDEKIPSPVFAQEYTEVTETGGGETTVTTDLSLSDATQSPETQMRDLENQIASIEASIRFRQRRGLDYASQQSTLTDLQQQLAALRMGM